MSSIAGVLAAPAFGPYSMTKFALEAMGKSMRGELAPLGIDVTLINPGPYLTGFNERMAQSMWEWFDEQSLNAPEAELFRVIGDFVTTGQRDPTRSRQSPGGIGRGRYHAPRTTSSRRTSRPNWVSSGQAPPGVSSHVALFDAQTEAERVAVKEQLTLVLARVDGGRSRRTSAE